MTDYDARRPQSDTMTLRLSVAGEEKAVLNRLRRLEPFTGAEVLNDAEFRVTLPRGSDTGAALDRAFRALAESGLPVRMMREEREDLEAVFLRAISRS